MGSHDRVGTGLSRTCSRGRPEQFSDSRAGKVGPNDEARLKVGYENTSVFVRIDAIQLLQNIQSGAPEVCFRQGTNPPRCESGGLVVMLGNSKANTRNGARHSTRRYRGFGSRLQSLANASATGALSPGTYLLALSPLSILQSLDCSQTHFFDGQSERGFSAFLKTLVWPDGIICFPKLLNEFPAEESGNPGVCWVKRVQ